MHVINVQLLLKGIIGMIVEKFYSKTDDVIEIEHGIFINQVSKPNNAKANILLIRGGVNHCFGNTYYTMSTRDSFSSDMNCFILETICPNIDPERCVNISKCINYIKSINKIPIYVMGFSLGGLLLMYYLSKGFDEADGYITVCSPYNMKDINDNIYTNIMYYYIYKQTERAFQATSLKDIYERANIDERSLQISLDSFHKNFKDKSEAIKKKLIYIYGSKDIVTKGARDDLPKNIVKICIDNGGHCCIDCIYYSTRILFWLILYSGNVQKAKEKLKKESVCLFSL